MKIRGQYNKIQLTYASDVCKPYEVCLTLHPRGMYYDDDENSIVKEIGKYLTLTNNNQIIKLPENKIEELKSLQNIEVEMFEIGTVRKIQYIWIRMNLNDNSDISNFINLLKN